MAKNSLPNLDVLQKASVVLGAVVGASRAMIEYRRFRQHQRSDEYTRTLQRQAWEKVLNGELEEAKVGNLHIRRAAPKDADLPASENEKSTESEESKDSTPAER